MDVGTLAPVNTQVVDSQSLRQPFLGSARINLNRLAGWIDAHPARSFAILSIFYACVVAMQSSFKLLWLDELITLHIARLDSAGAIWNALAHGADPNPPLIHIAVMLCRRLFGEYELALRLPAIFGYWIGMLSLFLFLLRRVPGSWALTGTLLSMTMGAFEYSYESRSYAVFYGFAMLAVYCWSRAAELYVQPRTRLIALAGMTFALAAGICTNYFAVLAFLPIALGEVARTLRAAWKRNRTSGHLVGVALARVDWAVWACMALAALPLLVFRPLIQRSIAQFAPYAWNKVSMNQVFDSYTQMVEVVLYPVLAILASVVLVRILARLCAHCRATMRPRLLGRLATEQASFGSLRRTLAFHECIAVLSLMAYPFLGYLVASIRGGMLSPRFVIPVCFGFAIAGTLAAYRVFGQLRLAGLALLVACLAWFVARESVIGYWYSEQKQCFYKVIAHLPEAEQAGNPVVQAAEQREPIVIADPLMVLTFQHYAPADMGSRIVFPVDFPAIRLYRGEDSPEENLWAGRNAIYHLPIVPLADLESNTGRYMIVAGDGNWLIEDLLHHRYPVKRLPINTRAGAIGGFTPLNHNTPVFYRSVGDRFFETTPGLRLEPIEFDESDNLPTGKLTPEQGGPFND